MNERVVPKMTNSHVVKLSNSRAIACVPRLELNGPTLRHFESQPDSPRIDQRLLNCLYFNPWLADTPFYQREKFFIIPGFAQAVDKYIIRRCAPDPDIFAGGVPRYPVNDSY